jgi:two-component system phosphate regulon sensor histidine kinase PhoR
MFRAWRAEVLWAASIMGGSLMLGWIVGKPQPLFWAGLFLYFLWHVCHFIYLQRWMAGSQTSRLPVTLGLWEEVFDGFRGAQLRERRRGRSTAGLLAEFRGAAARLPDAVVLLDERHRILWFNGAGERLLLLRQDRDLGRDITMVIDHPALEDGLAGSGTRRQLEIVSPASGARILGVEVTAPFGRRKCRLLVARDITPLHGLEQAQRDFAANVSHELRTPLTVFRGYIDAFKEGVGETEWARPIAAMDEQANRMQKVIDELLLLSRFALGCSATGVEAVAVPELLLEIVDEARALSGAARHRISLVIDPSLELRGSEGELRVIFSNLIFNAVRHTPPGTRIDVFWDLVQDQACLAVRDFGPGIAQHHLPRLTERFYRVEQGRGHAGGGSGLGLALVKTVLERCGGYLKITSEAGSGSTFACVFPNEMIASRSPELAVSEPVDRPRQVR